MLLRNSVLRQIESVPTQPGNDKTLVAAPAPVQTKVVERIVPPPAPIMPTPMPIPTPVAVPDPADMIVVVEPDIPLPDFDTVGRDYQTASPAELVNMDGLTVKKITTKAWTPDEIRSIYRQELASTTPRVTIVRWAEKEIDKLNA